MVYVSPADDHDIGGGGGGGGDGVDQHWLQQDHGRSKIYIDALRVAALAFPAMLLLLEIEEMQENEPTVRIPRVVACTITRRRTAITLLKDRPPPATLVEQVRIPVGDLPLPHTVGHIRSRNGQP